MSKDDYEVGYSKPPKHTQFKKGQSGNPKGRRKGARGIKSDLRDELKSMLTINENGEPVTLTKQRLMIKQLANQAAQGDIRAIHRLADMTIALLGAEDEGEGSKSMLSQEDEAILNDFVSRQTEQTNDK